MRRPAAGSVLGVVAIVIALGGTGIAAIPGGDGTIRACFKPAQPLVPVDEAAGCGPGEQLLVWRSGADTTIEMETFVPGKYAFVNTTTQADSRRQQSTRRAPLKRKLAQQIEKALPKMKWVSATSTMAASVYCGLTAKPHWWSCLKFVDVSCPSGYLPLSSHLTGLKFYSQTDRKLAGELVETQTGAQFIGFDTASGKNPWNAGDGPPVDKKKAFIWGTQVKQILYDASPGDGLQLAYKDVEDGPQYWYHLPNPTVDQLEQNIEVYPHAPQNFDVTVKVLCEEQIVTN